MSEQFAPRTDPEGAYERVCPHCGASFRTNNPRARYDSEACKSAAAFQRYWNVEANKEQLRLKAKNRQREKRKK